MMFNWHRSFTLGLGTPWRKGGKKKMPAKSEVVLTNVKMLSNDYPLEMPVHREPPLQKVFFHPNTALNYNDNDLNQDASQSTTDYAPPFSNLAPGQSLGKLRGLYKFESEDSGVELPSGANSPSTPTGSEQSFVVHSRDSSCDSGVLSASSSPAIDHMRPCKDAKETKYGGQDAQEHDEEGHPDSSEALQASAALFEDAGASSDTDQQNLPFAKIHDTFEKKHSEEDMDFLPTGSPSTLSPEHRVPITATYNDAFDGLQEVTLHAQLKRYPTSDSLDEYMDECCRLSEVNQRSSKALGSGLGYLEHICQLIEKIGQLQEHNLRLQKQICGLQKEKKMKQLKEEYFVQHCSCGAARALRNSYQEVKKHFNMRNRPHSMFIQSGNLSDLSMIPEMGGNYEHFGYKGTDSRLESGMLGLRDMSSKATSEENDVRHMWNRADAQAVSYQDQALRRIENHPWGRVRDLMKKTKLKNQNKLGLSSMAFKRSCPQLYRPDITSDLRKKERNSMIVLEQNQKSDNAWPY